MNARIERWVRASVRALRPYHIADAAGMVKLDAMENPYTWPSRLVGEWLAELRQAEINRYPDPEARELKSLLRRFTGVDENVSLLLGNGSDELIQIMAMAMAGPGRAIVAPEPGFVMYRLIAEVLGFNFVGVPLRAMDFALDPNAMLAAIDEHQPAIIFLSYPNNPTGNLFERADVEHVIARAPGLVVIDEAYYPFAGQTWLHDLQRYDNLVVMQTLSKTGLAGLRVGMLFGSQDWLNEFNKVRLPYNINVLSQVSARFILRHAEFLREQTGQITLDRQTLYSSLKTIANLQVWPSSANFLLFRVPGDARRVFEDLRQRGVLIKCMHGAHPALEGCLRVTVGTPGENAAFFESLRQALQKAELA